MQLRGCTLLMGLAFIAGQASANDPSVTDVAAKNKSAVEAIHTFSCKVAKKRSDFVGQQKSYPVASYIREGDVFRSKWEEKGKSAEVVVTGAKCKSIATSNGKNPRLVSESAYNALPLYEGDPWLDSHVKFSGLWRSVPCQVFLYDALDYPGTKTTVKHVFENGVEQFVVRVESSKGATGEYTLLPSRNFLVSKSVCGKVGEKPEDTILVEVNIEQFVEPVSGIHFPSVITKRETRGGKLQYQEDLRLTEVKVNHRLPDDWLQSEFRPNDQVQDRINGKAYSIGADGKSVVKERVLALLPPVRGIQGEISEAKETSHEPVSFFERRLLPASLAALVLVVIAWRWRSYHRHKRHASLESTS